MSIVDDAVQDRVAERWIGDDVVPLGHGDLTGDQERSLVVAIIDDLEQIAALIGGERLGPPVVEDNEIGALERVHQAQETAFAAGLGEIGEEARGSLVEHGEAVAAGFIPEGAGQPAFSGSGQAYDILPRNICSKLSFNIRIIRALVSASWF